MKTGTLIAILAVIVAVVWALIALTDLVLADYRALSIATPVMLLVVGTVLGLRTNGRNGAKH